MPTRSPACDEGTMMLPENKISAVSLEYCIKRPCHSRMATVTTICHISKASHLSKIGLNQKEGPNL